MNLRQFVVYKSPSDYPGKYVIREWVIESDKVRSGEIVAIDSSKERALEAMPRGLIKLMRNESDDPAIEEIWM